MEISKIFAHVACSDLGKSADWYGSLFGRSYDVSPMETLYEWHHREHAGLQLFLDADAAGSSTVTIFVRQLEVERLKLLHQDFELDRNVAGVPSRMARLKDPDGNLVVLVQATQD